MNVDEMGREVAKAMRRSAYEDTQPRERYVIVAGDPGYRYCAKCGAPLVLMKVSRDQERFDPKNGQMSTPRLFARLVCSKANWLGRWFGGHFDSRDHGYGPDLEIIPARYAGVYAGISGDGAVVLK